jgi:hypothetical protein
VKKRDGLAENIIYPQIKTREGKGLSKKTFFPVCVFFKHVFSKALLSITQNTLVTVL